MSFTMVRITGISHIGDRISCVVFVEDCKEPIHATLSVADGSMENDVLPSGYEWCVSHLHHAQNALMKMMQQGEFPESKTIMWY